MQTEPRTIVAVTSDPAAKSDQNAAGADRHAGVRRRATELAKTGATIILFDLAADTGPLASPLPTNWSGASEEEQFGSRLNPNDLEAVGRHYLAAQVQDLRSAGAQAYGWLSEDSSGSSLLQYAVEQDADLIVVSESDDELTAEFADQGPPGIEIETVPSLGR